MTQQKLDLGIWLILIILPLLCVVVFFLPSNLQNVFTSNTADWNPLKSITSVFVHGNLTHLTGNLVVFIVMGALLVSLNKRSNHEKFLFYSLLLLVFVLPLVYGVAFHAIAGVYGWVVNDFGLSLVVSGLIGLMVPTLVFYFKEELLNSKNVLLFFFSLFLVTSSVIVASYLTSIYAAGLFMATLLSGYALLFFTFRGMLRYSIKELKKQNRNKMLFGTGCFFVYLFLVTLLFPSNILQSQGSLVNIFSHYFGLYFGIGLGALVFIKRRLSRSG